VLGAGFAMKAGAGDTGASGSNALSAAKINGSSDAKTYIVVTVAAGETLWSLASAMADGGDVQTLVADIASANSLSGVDVEAGQKLRVPIK
jgi:LysM repeat protein